jgi:hypothetical protein
MIINLTAFTFSVSSFILNLLTYNAKSAPIEVSLVVQLK